MKSQEPPQDVSDVIAELFYLYENVSSRVLAIQSLLAKKRLISNVAVERETKRIAKLLVESRERQMKKLMERISKERRKRLLEMLDKSVGPIQ
jgi:hypothetical protein